MSTFCQIVWNWGFFQEESECLHVGGLPCTDPADGAFVNIVPFIFISFSFYFYPLLYLVSKIDTGCQVKALGKDWKEVNIKHAGLSKKPEIKWFG